MDVRRCGPPPASPANLTDRPTSLHPLAPPSRAAHATRPSAAATALPCPSSCRPAALAVPARREPSSIAPRALPLRFAGCRPRRALPTANAW
ncbi:uncharacterized protein M421DRAFT_258374 [Didymella exigua CBS 183.55]|uniref:Uncharacterized protein n=1 Tax=Didymella exigua CBS 183.55 TaxID=1150837 RepID=A0A6A5RDI2_9PLEO|nr:uncharacterized protein M421DRAFT_258374 [Didymella exigua CBS 183.55]KAF1925288.1 hypothetical protein M421DRAFT_258374 [Didymella exigua CBS 183.55]